MMSNLYRKIIFAIAAVMVLNLVVPADSAHAREAEPHRHIIVDVHVHYFDFIQKTSGFEALVERMDEAGVSHAVIFGMPIVKLWDEHSPIMPVYYLSDDSRTYYFSATDYKMMVQLLKQPEEIQERFFPFISGINPNDRFAARYIRQALEDFPGRFFGIGEVMSRHDDLTALTYGEPPRANHPALLEVYDLAAEFGLPVLLHHNIAAIYSPEPIYLDELRGALAHNRGANIIWAHAGISRRIEIPNLLEITREMLEENENLFIDLSWIVFEEYMLEYLDDWARFIDEFPDRFMLGSDAVGHWGNYAAEITKFHALLDLLEEETALMVASGNVLRLVGASAREYPDTRTAMLERFLRYVTYDTQSDPASDTSPSTETQMVFAEMLADEIRAIGLIDVTLCEHGVIMATLPANINAILPVIGFLAHMDTSPEFSGAGVVPRIHENYDGGDIVLDGGVVISPGEFPALLNYIGQDIITASGDTLLGADNKAGIAIILTAMEYLLLNPDIPRGEIRIAFTPDEEIGLGTANFDVEAFGADFAFTVDGGPLGEFTYENFNAARAVVEITGRSVHPGSAKGIMINAGLIGAEFAASLPPDETPATTEGYEGFFHLTRFEGNVESALLEILIRCFSDEEFEARKRTIEDLVAEFNEKYGENAVHVTITNQYPNMRRMIEPYIIEFAMAAFAAAGVEPVVVPARGGTDGAFLSYIGLPCPNIFTGGHNSHGPYEFIPLESMEKALRVIIALSTAN